MSINAYPLAWPDGWPRAKSRKYGKFGRGVRQYHGANSWMSHDKLSVADAVARVQRELSALGVPHGESITFGRCRHGYTHFGHCWRCGLFHPIKFIRKWLKDKAS